MFHVKPFLKAKPGGTGLKSQLPGRLREEDREFKACLGYRLSLRPPGQLSELGLYPKIKRRKWVEIQLVVKSWLSVC